VWCCDVQLYSVGYLMVYETISGSFQVRTSDGVCNCVQPELNIVQVSKLNIVHTEIMKYDTELKFASF
jgi:hypothetical protein